VSEPTASPAARGLAIPLLGVASLLAMGFAWSGMYTLVKLATAAGASPIGLALWEGLGAGIILILLCLVTRRRVPLGRDHLRFYVLSGVMGVGLPGVAIFAAAQHLPIGITSLIPTLVPIITYGLAVALRLERFSNLRALGIVAGLGGALLILLPEASLPDPAMVNWVLIGLIAALLYAFQNIYIARHTPPGTDVVAITCGTLTSGGVVLIPLLAYFGGWVFPRPPYDIIDASALGIAVISAFPSLAFIWVLRKIGPVYASQTAYFVTGTGVLIGILLYDERHSLWVWSALALMCLGVALVTAGEHKEPELSS
jgi:drug/metabolite transporter (DMT)-like permease